MEQQSITTQSLRDELKKVFAAELPKIPEYFKDMMPEDRMSALIKMMPYVLPQVERCEMKEGEGMMSW